MRIGITGDLHAGHTGLLQLQQMACDLYGESVDVVILAGDLGEGSGRFRDCLKIFRKIFDHNILVLCGNHDIWNHEHYNFPQLNSDELWNKVLPKIIKQENCIDLEQSLWIDGSVGIAGSIGWYDYSATEMQPHMPEAYYAWHKKDHSNDGNYVDLSLSDVQFSNMVGDMLCKRLAELQSNASIKKILVATHVPVFKQLMSPYLGGCAYFGNLTLGGRICHFDKVRWVISAHNHIDRQCIVHRKTGPPIISRIVPSNYRDPRYVIIDIDGG